MTLKRRQTPLHLPFLALVGGQTPQASFAVFSVGCFNSGALGIAFAERRGSTVRVRERIVFVSDIYRENTFAQPSAISI